ncbi:MAG: hypothetical protein ACTSRS_19395 [Candidatus Helarchaeota archaeon]
MSITPELLEILNKLIDDKFKEIKISTEHYDRLVKSIEKLSIKIHELAEAQARTEQRVNELVTSQKQLIEVQARTEQRMNELAEAQARTEQRMNELAEAQARTEQRMNELAEAQARTEQRMNELAEAQARTEQRMNELVTSQKQLIEAQTRTEQRMNELAEAQARTEQRVNELVTSQKQLIEAQARTEQRMNELAEAQAGSEKAIEKLTLTLNNLVREVRSLSDNFGYGLEDIARIMMPGWFERHEKVIVDNLNPTFLQIDHKEVEINLFAFGKQNGEELLVIGECKSRIYSGDVKKFNKVVQQVKEKFPGKKLIPFMFGFLLHPKAQRDAKANGIRLVATYMR